eukprot:TRINITY_DN43344_c0_g1_i1.p1 TRINITY_DN43344_c0_g1~~TRINITY_DN43344_c0_g1_i1.p1  ORF type:complete len:188 (+),score=41.04 TRINITY_DN43344_c0_g1_i1:143-706(+)
MTNRPPLPGTYDPKDWKCPGCKTLNFKKRQSCLACATPKPREVREPMTDWRSGKKDCTGNTHADWTCRLCGQFNFSSKRDCEKCGKPNPAANSAALSRGGDPDARAGSGGGHFDRPDPEDNSARKEYNSDDEEYDEFGRKKKKKQPGADAGAAPGKKGMSAKQQAALERLKGKTAAGRSARDRSRSR